MANPVVLPAHSPETYTDKKRKLKLEEDALQPSKLKKFQQQLLDDNVDYISLQSSLSLLQARLDQIQREIKGLSQLKRCIKESSSVKDVASLVSSNTDYLKEIHYKGCFIKCPVVNWDREYGLDMDLLVDHYGSQDIAGCHESINEQYEIIKRDKLFN